MASNTHKIRSCKYYMAMQHDFAVYHRNITHARNNFHVLIKLLSSKLASVLVPIGKDGSGCRPYEVKCSLGDRSLLKNFCDFFQQISSPWETLYKLLFH